MLLCSLTLKLNRNLTLLDKRNMCTYKTASLIIQFTFTMFLQQPWSTLLFVITSAEDTAQAKGGKNCGVDYPASWHWEVQEQSTHFLSQWGLQGPLRYLVFDLHYAERPWDKGSSRFHCKIHLDRTHKTPADLHFDEGGSAF